MADKACNYSIRKGLQISRSTIRWYEHNDMADLERVLAKVVKEQAKKPLTRRFIITEGFVRECGRHGRSAQNSEFSLLRGQRPRVWKSQREQPY